MQKKGKLFRNFILFILLIIVTFSVLLNGEDITQILNILGSVKLQYVLIGILCMAIYISFEAINIGRTLKKLNEKSSFIKNLKYALIGFFFSAITPAASGGQPMQIYYMYKDNIQPSNATLALLLNLTSMQIVTIGFALISLCFNYQYLNRVLLICFVIGILLNLTALVLLLVAIISKRLSRWLINFAVKVLKFFGIGNIEGKKEKLETQLEQYQESAIYIKKNRGIMLKTLLTTCVQFLTYYSITYWTYKALGMSGANILQITSMQSVLYATVSGIPSPGAVGVTEGAFTEIFRNIYPGAMMSSAILLNRGINFYLFVIFSGVITIVNHIKSDYACEEKNDIQENIIDEKMEEPTDK